MKLKSSFHASKSISVIATFTLCIAGIPSTQAQLTSGNLVVERVGSGAAALTNGSTAVFVDQFTTSGGSVNTINLPNASTRPISAAYNLTASGTATSEGLLTRSANGLTINLAGYNGISSDTSNIANTATTTVLRTIGVIDGSGAVTTSKAFTALSGNNPRSAVSLDGSSFHMTGGAGIASLGTDNSGAGTSLTTRTTRQGNIFNNTLFVSSGSASSPYSALGIYQVGSAGTLPTSSPTFTKIIDSAAPYAFQFNTSMTVAYVTNDSNTGGIEKWTSNGAGVWTKTGTLALSGTNTSQGARGLTVDWSNPSAPALYATTTITETGGAGGNKIVKITDDGTTFTSLAVTTLATAGTNQIFRGVDQALLPSVWTGNSGGNWSSAATTTYANSLGAVATPFDNWSTTLVNGTNLAFQKVNAASLSLANNTSLTNVSSINFNGGGTISGGQNTAYTLSGSALTLSGTSATSAIGTFTANNTSYTSVIANNSGVTQTVSIPLTLGAANQAFRASSGALAIDGTVANGGFALTVGGSANTTFGSSSAISGSGGLNKVEGGTLTLNGTNNYTGATDVQAGKLVVNGSITSATTVSSAGSTLGGTGTITGNVQVNSGAILAAGNSAGKLAVTGDLTLASNSIFEWELGSETEAGRGSNFDAVDVTGTLDVTGSVYKVIVTGLDIGSTFWDAAHTWDVFNKEATGTFASFELYNASNLTSQVTYNTQGSFTFDNTTGDLKWNFTAVPEPTSALAGLLITAGLLRRRRGA